ncbi:MAG: hypothetical protein FH761_07035 [Firmicutes bacterium]|nr:hypothetical protein [Bacillota bacterium]
MDKNRLTHLNTLSQVNNNKGIKFLHPAASPGSHCPMHTTLATLLNIKGLSSLVVGMAECGYYSRFVVDYSNNTKEECHYVYELDSNEVVFGCSSGVKKAVLQMAEEGAKNIMIIMTCVPGLIGEDPQAIIEEISYESDVKVVFVDMAHFKRNGYKDGYSKTLAALADAIKVQKDSEKSKKPIVNFLGNGGETECNRLQSILKESEIDVLKYGVKLDIEELNSSLGSQLNIVYSNNYLEFAEKLKEKYEIPYISLCDAYDLDTVEKRYEKIFKHLDISGEKLENLYTEKKPRIEEFYQKILSIKEKKSFIITSPSTLAVPLSVSLIKLGFKPFMLHIEEMDMTNLKWKDKLLELGEDPYVTYITNKDKITEVLDNEIDIYSLGNCNGIEEKVLLNDKEMIKIQNLTGFERVLKLLEFIDSRLS